MPVPNRFGTAFDGPDRRHWPSTGLRRPYSVDPGPLSTASEIAVAFMGILSAGALGVFLPDPAEDKSPLSISTRTCASGSGERGWQSQGSRWSY